MQLMIRNNTAAPIYQQIYQQIKEQIINGTLEEDTMLPSIRSLAKELRISIITTKRAYEELERDGFVYTIAGKGVFDHRKENYPDIAEAIPGRKYKMTLYIHS